MPASLNRWDSPIRRHARRLVQPVFLVAVVATIGFAAWKLDWGQVLAALRRIPAWRLGLAALFSAISYLGYSFTDLFARPFWQQKMRPREAMRIAFISYAFNQNFGALLGTIGFRLRLYSRHGLTPSAIARIVGMGFVTNWLGYFLLAGALFAAGHVHLPAGWALGNAGLRAGGAALLSLIGVYVAACRFARRRERRVFGRGFELPSLNTALRQLGLSLLVWLSIIASLITLMPPHADALQVTATFLLACIAGLISHVPAGLGVIEAVFIALLGHQLGHHELIASLLAYRAVYYLMPLSVAGVMLLRIEAGYAKLNAGTTVQSVRKVPARGGLSSRLSPSPTSPGAAAGASGPDST